MKTIALALSLTFVGVSAHDASAAEPAVYRPGVEANSVEHVGWRGDVRRADRRWDRAQRQFQRDYRDFRGDYRDYRRDTYDYRRNSYPTYRYGYRGYRGYNQGGVRIGNFGFYW